MTLMEMKNIMENKKLNTMGSEVVEGFTCKPKKLDPNKPIMFFKTQVFICDGERCAKANKNENLALYLRELIKDMDLHNGAKRIKITRANCFGACRFRQVGVVFENTKVDTNSPNNNIWLRNIHQYDEKKWKEFFTDLSKNKNLNRYAQIPMEEINE